jgi:general secretion pathway protein D
MVGAALLLGGCPKGNTDYDAGKKAASVQDYDTALVDFDRALRQDPTNPEYKLRVTQAKFDASQAHMAKGKQAFKNDDLQLALAEYQKASLLDPSNVAAEQEVKRTTEAIAARTAGANQAVNTAPPEDEQILAQPPQLKPLSAEMINVKMTNDARVVFDTIAKMAGVSVVFDPDFTSRRITAELPNVTLEQALDTVCLETKSFWKAITPNVIFIAPDQPQKRKDIEDEEVQTFYLSNTLTPQDLTEVVNGLRQLLDLHRLQQVNSQNAIVIRDTPDKLAVAAKIIRDIDKAKPEVLIHVQVLTASLDRLRDLGFLPGQSVGIAFTPRTKLQPNSGSSTSGSSSTSTGAASTVQQITLGALKDLGVADYSITLPGATANAILTDDRTKIIQDPEVRVTDGQKATLKIGSRVPVATGSFQAGVGVGTTGGAGVVNPLVNTQFQYIDVGVNVEVTPRVHPDGEVSMKLVVDVSQITGTSNIGGINQPVIGQKKIEHDIRLKEGEVSILGGLIERTDTHNINGIPGLGEIPALQYMFSDNSKEIQEDETLIVLTPHILRFPSINADNLTVIGAGTDSNVKVYREPVAAQPAGAAPAGGNGAGTGAGVKSSGMAAPGAGVAPASMTTPAQPGGAPNPDAAVQLHFEPNTTMLKTGDSATIGLAVSNVQDLYSIPLLIHYDPAVISVEEVRDGGFLGGSNSQNIAIVQRIDAQRGEVVVSATRQPGTVGVNGTGTILGFVVHALAPGTTHLQVLQVNAHNSQQATIPMVSGEATIQVH